MIASAQVLERTECILNILNHISINFISIYLTYVCLRKDVTITAIHGWLCTIGYQLLMAESILTLYTNNWLFTSYSRDSKKIIHWVLQVVGCGMALIGAIIKIVYKDIHFKTVHGITGIIATILLCFSLLSGLSALYSQTLRKIMTPVNNKTVHIILGLLTFVIGMVSLFYGYNTGFLKRKIAMDFAVFLKFLTILTVIVTALGPFKTLVPYVKSIFG